MNHMRILGWLTGAAVLAGGVVCGAQGAAVEGLAQQQPAGSGSGQPARAVRLAFVEGQVKLAQGSQVLADKAVANTPLFEGSQLITADSGKAEIQFEDGSVARLSPDSSLTLEVLRGAGASADAEIQVNGGLAYLEIQGGGLVGQIDVHFGSSVITASGFTVFRIDLDTAPGQIAVFSGNAHLVGNNGAFSVDMHGNESVTLSQADPTQYNLEETIKPDSWDAWNSDRDQALTAEAANQTSAPANMGDNQNPGWNDLDSNGSWYNVPDEGYVWSPSAAADADFDPYGNGNWMWTPGYGYLWASGYPWGYLPFQCGLWNFYAGFGWGWAPGPGACVPWWGVGFYRGPNIGHRPPGYHPIPRPISPRRPIAGTPMPMVAVNRNERIVSGVLPARTRSGAVTISGHAVQPLRPLAARPAYSLPTAIVGASRAPRSGSGAPSVNLPPANTRPGYSHIVSPSSASSEVGNSFAAQDHGTAPAGQPASRSSYQSPEPPVVRSTYTPPAPSHPSGGNATGGSGHASGGSSGGSHGGGGISGGGGHSGGGGGGGASHH